MQRLRLALLGMLLVVLGLSAIVGAESTNVALGKSYTLSPTPAASYADSELTKITDGLYRFAWGDMVGWADSTQNPVVTIDLGDVTENITNITARFMRSAGSAVTMPVGLTVRSSLDGQNFAPVGSTRALYPDPPTNEAINTIYFEVSQGFSARYVQVEIDQLGSGWVMLAEVEVLTGEQPKYFEIARGAAYDFSLAPHENYADPDGTKLTDGDAAFAWEAMVGWQAPSANPVITLDLGDFAENIEIIGARFMRSDQSIVTLPERLILSISSDGSRWFKVGDATATDPDPAANEQINTVYWRAKDELTREVGRYIRIEIVPAGDGWTLLNEITVGVYREKQDGGK